MRRHVLLLIIAASSLAVPVTATGQGADDPVASAPDARIVDGAAQKRLDAAKAKFAAAKIRSYRYTISRSCFCAPRELGTPVVVRNGKPTKKSAKATDLSTVPRIFRTIRLAIRDKVHQLRVTYGRYGVPKDLYIDRDARIADEEVGYTITKFKRL